MTSLATITDRKSTARREVSGGVVTTRWHISRRVSWLGWMKFSGVLVSAREESVVNMMTSSNGNIFRVTGPLSREFTGDRWIPRTKTSDVQLWYFYMRLNKRLSKQSWGWWFETPPRSLWRRGDEHTEPLKMSPFCRRFRKRIFLTDFFF